MSPVDPLLGHLISRLEADVRFLADQGHISRADSQTVLDVFSRAGTNASMNNITGAMGAMRVGNRDAPTGMPTPYGAPSHSPAPPAFNPPSAPYNGPENTAPPAFPGGPPVSPAYASTPSPAPGNALKRPVPPPPPPAPAGPQCKAMWDYNLDGLLKDDLSFRSGDIIQIVKEDNADWWTGRLNGREGMFPANHVEKLPSTPSYTPSYGYEEKQQLHQHYAPPPGPPATYQQGGPVQAAPPPEEEKKGKFGKYGGLMATSASSGVGFGAGAAIGSGLINAIF